MLAGTALAAGPGRPALARPCSSGRRGASSRLPPRAAAAAHSDGGSRVVLEDSATTSFLDWARSAGIQFAKLQPAVFAGVRGLAATADIAGDEIIVSVPRQAALTLPPKQRCPCQEFVTAAWWDGAPWFAKLGVRLLAEQRKGRASPYYQWLQQLPQQVNSPVNWSRELVQQLQYAHLIHKVTEQQHEWTGLYERFVADGLVNKAAPPSKQEFFRALSLVRSRTFSGPYVASTLADRLRLGGLVAGLVAANTALGGDLSRGLGAAAAVFLFNIIYEVVLSGKLRQYAMCPVIDLFNHSSVNTSEVSYDYPRDAFIVSAAAPYAPGTQVFISYGTQTNDSLMQMYGFAEPDNPADVYVMTSLLKWLEQLQPACQARLDALNRSGLLHALQEVPITRQGFGAPTLQALRYLLTPGGGAAAPDAGSASASGSGNGAAAAMPAQGRAAQLPPGGPGSYESATDPATEEKIALVLVHACQMELAVLGTTLQQDAEVLNTPGASSSNGRRGARRAGGAGESSAGSAASVAAATAAAAVFRIEKKKVLLACLSQLTGGAPDAAAPGQGAAQPPPQQQPRAAAAKQ